MRVAALYDSDGRILAAARVYEDRSGPVPAATENAEVYTFDVPEHAAEMPLDEICTNFRVDVGARELRDGRESAS